MLNSSKQRGRRLRYWLIGFIGALVIGVVVWQFYKYKLVHGKIDKAVTENTKGLYTIRYEGLVIDEVGGSLHVKNIEIVPDTAVYNQMAAEKKSPSVLLRLSIPALDITGVKTPKALLSKQVEGGRIEINNPTIEILLSEFQKDSTVHNPAKDISRQLLGKLLKISIDSIKINHANVTVRKFRASEPLLKGENVSFLLAGLLIDSSSASDSSRILFSREMEVRCEELLLPSKNKKYKFHIGDLRFTSQDDALYVGQVRLIPQLPEAAFAASFPVQKDRYDFSLSAISIRHINRRSLWHKQLEADSMVIGKSSFKVYRDLSYPRDTVSKVGRYPHEQLMQLKLPVNIRELVFVKSFIEYKERNAKSDSAGKLQFYDASATITNVTNMKKVIARNNVCKLRFSARLLNKAPVNATISMILKDPKGSFTIDGKIGTIDAADLNPLIEPMGLARLEKGRINKLSFRFAGTDSTSDGSLVMLYDGIKISLLKKDKDDNTLDKKGLVSLLANIILKKSNPSNDGEPRVATVHFDRIMDKSFFNLIWKSIFTGIKKSVGMK